MRQAYETPNSKLRYFKTQDVIMTSGDSDIKLEEDELPIIPDGYSASPTSDYIK